MHTPGDKTDFKILKAAGKIFSQKGYYKTDVEEIAARAGVGKGTVYRRFGNKKSLFLSLIEWGLNSLRDGILKELDDIEDPIERIQIAIKTYLAFFERNRGFYRILVQERIQFRERIDQQFREKYLTHFPLLEKAIQEGVRQGKFRDLDAKSVAISLLGMTNAIIYYDLISKGRSSLQRDYQTVIELFLRGMLAPKHDGSK